MGRCCHSGGIARFDRRPVTVIALRAGIWRKTKEQLCHAPSEGYRKALRLMKQAEKFGRPVICR